MIVLEGEDAQEFEKQLENQKLTAGAEELMKGFVMHTLKNCCLLCSKELEKHAFIIYKHRFICSYCLETLYYLFARDFRCDDASTWIPEWVAEMERRVNEQ